jgi:hypothetical protein
MPTDIVRVSSIAYSPDAIPAHRGDAPTSSLVGFRGEVMQMTGLSTEWDGEGTWCVDWTKAGNPCTNTPMEGSDVCVAHKRSRDARERRNEGV